MAFSPGAFGFAGHLRELITAPPDIATQQLPAGKVVVSANTNALTTPTALDDRLLDTIRAVPGVEQAVGSYDQPLAFVVKAGIQRERPTFLRGVLLSSTVDSARWQLLSGRFPSGPLEVALDVGGLAVAGASDGGTASLQVPVGTIEVRVVGVVAPADAAGDPSPAPTPGAVALSSAHVLVDPAWGPRLLDAEGRADRIDAIPEPGLDPDLLASRIRRAARVPPAEAGRV